MKKFVFTKKFNNEEEVKTFVDKYVGEKYYWQTRPNWVNIDGCTMTIAMKHGCNFYSRKNIYDSNGFVMERRDV